MPSINEFEHKRQEQTSIFPEDIPTLTDVLDACHPPLSVTQYVYGVSSPEMNVLGFDTRKTVEPMIVIGDDGAGKSRLAQLVIRQAGGRERVRVDVITRQSEFWPTYSSETVHVHDLFHTAPRLLTKYIAHIYHPSNTKGRSLMRILCIDSLPLLIDEWKKRPQEDGFLSNLRKILKDGPAHNVVIMASMNPLRFIGRSATYDEYVDLFTKRVFGYTKDEKTASTLGCLHPEELAHISPGVDFRLSTPKQTVDFWAPRPEPLTSVL